MKWFPGEHKPRLTAIKKRIIRWVAKVACRIAVCDRPKEFECFGDIIKIRLKKCKYQSGRNNIKIYKG